MRLYLSNGKLLVQNGKLSADEKCCCGGYCCIPCCSRLCCTTVIANVSWRGCDEDPYAPLPDPWSGGNELFYPDVNNDCSITMTLPDIPCGTCGDGPLTNIIVRARAMTDGYDSELDCDANWDIVQVQYRDGSDPNSEWTTNPQEVSSKCPGIFSGVTFWNGSNCGTPDWYLPFGSQITRIPIGRGIIGPISSGQCSEQNGVFCTTQATCNDINNLGQPIQCGLRCQPSPTEWRIVDQLDNIWFFGDVVFAPNQQQSLDPCQFRFWEPSESDPCGLSLALEDYPSLAFSPQPLSYRARQATLRLQVLGCGEGWLDVVDCACSCNTTWAVNIDPCRENMWDQDIDPVNATPPGACAWTIPNRKKCANGIYTPSDKYLQRRVSHQNGQAFKFVGGVDGEGSNLWNWEDANGNVPAGFISQGSSIVITGELKSWHEDGGGCALSFDSVTVTGSAAKLGVSLTADTLLVEAGASVVENGECRCDRSVDEVLGTPTVVITVNTLATFNNATNEGTIIGTCVFNNSENKGSRINGVHFGGHIIGNVTFNNSTNNSGRITGDGAPESITATFNGSGGTEGYSVVYGGSIAFYEGCSNYGTIFIDGGLWNFKVYFEENTIHDASGVIQGRATFNANSINRGLSEGGPGGFGTFRFNGTSRNEGVVQDMGEFYENSSNLGEIWYGRFFGNSTHLGTVLYWCEFFENSRMVGGSVGTVGDPIPENITAYFRDNACYVSGTAGMFDPDPPPQCPP